MSFLKKLFNISEKENKQIEEQEVYLSLDDLFVHNFKEKGGKFIYCTTEIELKSSFEKIFKENNWSTIHILNKNLKTFLPNKISSTVEENKFDNPVFTTCEHLVADKGDILFSSNQLGSKKLKDFTDNFIVYATTSQLVKDTGQALTGIKSRYVNNLPTNISSIKNYNINNVDDNFLNYGNNNSKNLYLLLFEDL